MTQFTLPTASATLDIDVLRSAVAIAEEGTIAAAAGRVARTPAALSMQIRKLEDMLGRELFERGRHGMTPTAAGEQLLEYARRMIELNRAAIQAFSLPELTGEVNVGLVDSFGSLRLAEVLGEFARSHPLVRVNVRQNWTVNMAPGVDNGEMDLAVLTPGGSTAMRDTDLVLREEPMAWLAREGGRAARQTPVPLALADTGCAWRQLASEAMQRHAMQVRTAFVSDADVGQLAAVRADLAVAPMPVSYLEPGLVDLTGRAGFAPMGVSQLALRVCQRPSATAQVLAALIAESFGKVWGQGAAA